MCYICSCFTWTLDLIQRILTFFLSCWLACAVCCGLGVAIIAGIAYGYNYCLAEFIVLTRSDVSVYMRRGQFYDKPDLHTNNSRRRSGDDDEEYQQEVSPGDNSLSGQWEKDQDTRKYAEKLTKYSGTRKNIVFAEQSDNYYQQEGPSEDNPVLGQWGKNQDTQNYSSQRTFVDSGQQINIPEGNIYNTLTTPPPRRVSILPNPYISKTLLQSGSSEIVMRMFEPVSNTVPEPSDVVNEYDGRPAKVLSKETDMNTTLEMLDRKTVAPDMRIQLEDTATRKLITIRHWGTSPKPVIMEYSADMDEDNAA